MGDGERELLSDMRVLGVELDGEHILVDVYGSERNLCGSVRYHFPAKRERRANAEVLRRWAEDMTVITMVTQGSTITLLDEQALVERALQA